MAILTMICGPNGAGKSTLSRALSIRRNIVAIDSDSFRDLTPIAAGKAAANLARQMIRDGVSFARESTLTSRFDFRIMEEAKSAGYMIELIYVRLASPGLAVERARAMRGGHNVPEEDIVRRFHRSLANLPKAAGLADRLFLLDNSGDGYVKIRADDFLAACAGKR